MLIVNANRFDRNGMSSVIINYYTELKKYGVHADLVANDYIEPEFKKEFEINGDKVYVLKNRNKLPWLYIRKLKSIKRREKYDIIYIHGNSATLALELMAFRKFEGKIVVHAHGVQTDHPIIHSIFKKMVNKRCDYRFAASKEAGNFLFGRNRFIIIKNGIKSNNYHFDYLKRKEIRSNLKLGENDKLILQLGAFTYQKNYDFTIEVAKYMQDCKNLFFLLLGDGPEKTKIEKKIIKLGLSNKVFVHSAVSNVNEFLMAADGVMFPSRFEPFGIVALEAQAAGVPIAVSNVFIKKLKLTEIINYIPLDKKNWADWINTLERKKYHDSERYSKIIKNSGYDISKNAVSMIEILKKIIEDN